MESPFNSSRDRQIRKVAILCAQALRDERSILRAARKPRRGCAGRDYTPRAWRPDPRRLSPAAGSTEASTRGPGSLRFIDAEALRSRRRFLQLPSVEVLPIDSTETDRLVQPGCGLVV